MLRLRVGTKSTTFEDETITIGRSSKCEITLQDANASRHHSKITKIEGGYLLKDLGSRNGTSLNGRKIKSCILKAGDTLEIGDTKILVEAVDSQMENTMVRMRKQAIVYEDVKAKMRRKMFKSFVIPVVCVVVVFIGIYVVANLFLSNDSGVVYVYKKETVKEYTDKKHIQERALAALQDFEKEIEGKDISSDHLRKFAAIRDLFVHAFGEDERLEDIYNGLLDKRYKTLDLRIREGKDRIDTFVEKEDFAKATQVLGKLRESVKDAPEQLDQIAAKIEIKAEKSYLEIEQKAESMKKIGRFDDAEEIYKTNIDRFNGTRFHALLENAKSSLQVMKVFTVSAQKPQVEQVIKEIVKPVEQLPDYIEPPKEIIAILKTLQGKSVQFGTDFVLVQIVTDKTIKLKAGTNEKEMQFKKLKPQIVWELIGNLIKFSDYPAVIKYLKEAKLDLEASRLEHDLTVEQNKKKFEKTYKALSTEITKATTLKALEEAFNKASQFLWNDSIPSSQRDEIKKQLVSALSKLRAAKLDEMKKSVKPATDLKNLKIELDNARGAALRLIFDTKAYPYGKGKKGQGQDEVDELVGKVRSIWESNMAMSLDNKSQGLADEVKKLGDILRKLGEDVIDDLKELEELVLNSGAKGSVSIKKFALSREDREFIELNEIVDKYNEGFRSKILAKSCPNTPEDIVDQANILNAYREMMGRKKLFLDPRLVRAAQDHTVAMAQAGKIWHNGSDGSPSSRAAKHGYKGSMGENVAMWSNSPAEVHHGWYTSSGHHRNMLNAAWNIVGVGHVGKYWTQKFGQMKNPPYEKLN